MVLKNPKPSKPKRSEIHSHKKDAKPISELRQDLVSGDWILIAPGRAKRPEFFSKKMSEKQDHVLSKNKDPFEDPQKFGNAPPVLVYQNKAGNDWFLQVIPNKFPAVGPGKCGVILHHGPYSSLAGTGSHEILILRDHNKHLAQYKKEDLQKVLLAYQDRYKSLAKDDCVQYISIFHNHGKEAGASVPHPHSQILALPVIPPDIGSSINGSREYFHKNGNCIHCLMISHELKAKKRIVFENKSMVVFAPYASRSNFELRLFPKRHEAYFEKVNEAALVDVADALQQALWKIYKGLHDPAFNFFLHTSPVILYQDYQHYHWHIEILPKVSTFGGFELGTGIDIISIAPELTAKFFRKII